MSDENNKPKKGADKSAEVTPVDIKDEAAVLYEFRRLNKKIRRLVRELRAEQYRVKAFKKLFYEDAEYGEVRELILSFADEYAIVRNEVEDRRRWRRMAAEEAKNSSEEIIDKFALVGGNVETARLIFSDCTDAEKHDLKGYTYWSNDKENITRLQLSPEAIEILEAFDRYEYNNNREETRSEHRHKFPRDWRIGNGENDDDADGECAETLPDNGTQPIALILKETREECEKITVHYHELHLAQVKEALEKNLPAKQAKRYYRHFYEKLRVADISESEGVAPATISESLSAAKKNIMIYNIELVPTPALREKFWSEITPWKEVILFYNGGQRS
jgi:hypothetical protein